MNPSRSRITPEPFPNETRAARALRACADQGSGIRDQVVGIRGLLQDQVDNLTVGAARRQRFGFGAKP